MNMLNLSQKQILIEKYMREGRYPAYIMYSGDTPGARPAVEAVEPYSESRDLKGRKLACRVKNKELDKIRYSF